MNMFGGPSKCPRCEKTVYAAEQIIGPGRQVYHKFCLKCTSCNKRLDSYSLVEHNQQPYCKPCHVRGFGTRDLRHQNLPQTSPPASPSSRNAQPASPPPSIDGLAGRFSSPSAPKSQNEPPLTPPRTVSPATEAGESENFDTENVESNEPQSQPAAPDSSEAPTPDIPEPTKGEREGVFPPPSTSLARAPALPPRIAPLRSTYNFEYRQKSGIGSRFPAPLSPSAIKKGSTGFAALHAGPPSPTKRTTFGPDSATQSPLTPSATGSTPIRSIVSTPTGTIRQVPPIVTSSAMQSSVSSPARPLVQTPTGMRPMMTGGVSNIFGGRVECPRCAKAVYLAEQVAGPGGRKFHKLCLRCIECNSSLNAGRFTEKDGEPMCRNCYSKTYGPQGSGYALMVNSLPPPGHHNAMVDTRMSLYATSLSLALLLYRYWRSTGKSKIRHPPSPSSLPFVGNLFSVPSGPEYYAFATLGEQLKSDIIFLNILGHKIVILNSAEAASEILEKRSALYSDRPSIPMVTDPSLMNWSGLVSLARYNDVWRNYRRMMNNWFNIRAVDQFNDLQDRQARSLLQRLLSATDHAQPFERVKEEIFFSMGSSMLQLAYGYKPQSPQDPFFKEAVLAFHNATLAGMQTNFLVNTFPTLLYVPDWFPGTSWKRIGREWGVQQDKAKTKPYEWVKAQVASGSHQPSLLGSLLQGHKLLSGLTAREKEERLKEVGIVTYGGGTDTSANFLVSFVAEMVLNPHVQARAQEELDTVLGQGVLPSVSDKKRLPYIRNLIDEVFRLHPVVPLGRDPRHYENPEVFDPDRYLDSNVQRPPVFGWGRRICPGAHFAESSVFINTASLLATYTFSKKRSRSGQEIMPQIEVDRNSIFLELKPFDFELKLRSDAHHQLILGTIND
ncbi:unnamed protein product [Rhizoctonia solani]|uniref:LIM zinc-binding domain-containing protein n=1 Tax=Rhizoctonia solani TaxID=456999 RepID=A0A8H3DNK3_9AGAM|nr:unnamed protein product [Rhizoctonia solani]